MHVRALISGLWVGGIVLQGLLVVVLLARKGWKSFPIFASYASVSFASSVAGFLIYRHLNAYFYFFWIKESITVILGLAVVYEIFSHLFSLHTALRKLATNVFQIAVVVLIVLALSVIYWHSPAGLHGASTGVLAAEEAARILEVGLLLVLFLSTSAFGLHWKQSIFGIGIGLGIFTAVQLIGVTMRSQVGPAVADVISVTSILAFDISLLIWIGYMLVPERVATGEVPKTAQLEQWNQAIAELIHQ